MCFTVQLSRFLSVFDSFDILSYLFWLVKNFFWFFQTLFCCQPFWKLPAIGCCRFATAILDYHIFFDLSTTFLTFFIIFGSFCSILRKLVTSCFHIASAATCLLYHMLRCLSTTFFIIFWIVSTLLNYYGVFCHLSVTARL